MTDRYVYFIRPVDMDGPVKIGSSRIPRQRLQKMQDWSPFELEIAVTIPGSFDLEFNLQDCFFDDHLHHEWFRASLRLTATIARLRAGVPIHEACDLTDRRGSARAAHYAKRSASRRAAAAAKASAA